MEECEIERYRYSATFAWEYLQSIGKTDLALLDEDEGLELMHVIVKNFHEAPPF
jgi:hypothetical protein